MPDWLINIPAEFWSILGEMSPYLLFGFLVAGILSVLISPRVIERHLGGRGVGSIIKAAAFGVPLPLCSCGVIPVSASLRQHGAGKGATTAFLISTPQTGADSIMVTYGLLGGVYAVFRPIIALLTGIAGGIFVNFVAGKNDNSRVANPNAEGHHHSIEDSHRRGKILRIFAYGFGTLPKDIGRALIVGLLIAALITTIVPKDYFSSIVRPGIWQILVLVLAGIPVYVCATSSVPMVYALIVAGVSPGAAFAFLMAGPATNAATIATIWKVMGKRTAVVYLCVIFLGALAGGMLLDQIITGEQIIGQRPGRWMLPSVIKHISAVVLLGVLTVGIIRPYMHRKRKKENVMGQTRKLKIAGMTCSHCADSIRRALLECPGVESVRVDLAGANATISGENLDVEMLRSRIEGLGLGYRVMDGKDKK